MTGNAYQTITLATIHHSVENVEDLKPEREHALAVGKLIEVAQENLANQCRRLNPSLAHSQGIGVVDLRLEKTQDEREENLVED